MLQQQGSEVVLLFRMACLHLLKKLSHGLKRPLHHCLLPLPLHSLLLLLLDLAAPYGQCVGVSLQELPLLLSELVLKLALDQVHDCNVVAVCCQLQDLPDFLHQSLLLDQVVLPSRLATGNQVPSREGGRVADHYLLLHRGGNADSLEVGRHEDRLAELLLDDRVEDLHLGLIPVHEHDALGVDVAGQVDDALRIRVGRERYVGHPHLHLVEFLVDGDLLRPLEQFVPQRALHAVPGDDDGVALIPTPLLEHLHARPPVQHARGGEEHVGGVGADQGLVEGLHLLELEHVVAPRELLLYVLVLPVHEQTVEEVGLLDQPCREVDRHVAVGSLPVALQQHRQLLGASQGEDGDQHLPALVHSFVDDLQHLLLPLALGVPDGGGVGGFGDEQVGGQSRGRCRPQVPVGVRVVVPSVNHRQPLVLDVEHAGPEHVPGVVGGHPHPVDVDGLEKADAFDPTGGVAHLPSCVNVELLLLLLLGYDLPVVLQHQRQQALGGRRGVDGAGVGVVLGEVGQGSAVVEVEVGQEQQVDRVVDGVGGRVQH